ncbi:copper resistance protein CopC/CopD [Actinospica sp. MGRD01-02]|uniref:Copper resistance protein CopC/CopD n=1 Tax=Actinospica acidithermotolerans TaxID=2828514 RepID=A0A941IN69_9ACTN|nr:copper resistance protein CopC [Actinospica acidithermotolerans]MBR7829211.1 copper resistance protein CopC/CopD [Actinospica acidithermotolerans]
MTSRPVPGPAGFRRARALLAAIAVAVGLVLAVAAPASAHATLEGSAPAANDIVSRAPSQVTLTFDEAVGVSADSIRVFDPNGDRVDDGSTKATSDPDVIEIGLRSGLGYGTYTVAWHVISADSHPVEGAFVFSVGTASATKVNENTINVKSSTAVGFFYGALRWLGYLGYALLFGGFAFLAVCWPGGASDRRSFRLLAIGWTASLASAIGVLVVQGAYAGELPLGSALDTSVLSGTLGTRFGQAVVARLLLLALAAPLLAATLNRLPNATARGRTYFVAVIGFLGVLGAATWAAADHASTGIQVPIAVFSDLVHLTAMGLWLGGLAMLLLVVCRPATDSTRDLATAVTSVQRFSRLALACVGALVASGIYQTWRNVGSWAALSNTPYGRMVVLKIGGLCILAGLGWMARDWIRRTVEHTGRVAVAQAQRMEPAGLLAKLRRSVALEAVVALVILGISSILVESQPGRTVEAAQTGPTNVTLDYNTGTASGTITIYVGPGTEGQNQTHLYLNDAKGLPYTAAELTVQFTLPAEKVGPLNATVIRDGPGHYVDQPLTLSFPGTWTMSVTIRSDDFDETTLNVPVKISP